jgi:hypothetical protein
LRTLETPSKSLSLQKHKDSEAAGAPKIDYIAVWDYIPLEILFVEVAGGINGRNQTKSQSDVHKLHLVMKDSLDLCKQKLGSGEDECGRYTVYGLAVNG